jgi:hypothetical protein
MKHTLQFLTTCLISAASFSTIFSQQIPADSLFLGQTPPGATPKVFALPVSNGLMPGERITITSDGKEIYYSELNSYPPTIHRIKCFKYLGDKWQGPFNVFEGYDSPGLSISDSVMYIEKNINSTSCSYYSIRNDSGWSSPVRLFSTNQQTHYYQQTNSGNFYLASKTSATLGNSDICKQIINNSDTTIQSLGLPLNTTTSGNDFCISKDESFIIMSKFIPGSASDMYISFMNGKGNWTNPKILENPVSAPNPYWEFGQFITKDNKYLFFTRGGNDLLSYHIYWVKIDALADSLKHTSFTPYLKNSIPNKIDTVGHLMNYILPDSIFIDDDGNNTLSYTAKMSNGSALPSWITFNSQTKTFSGTSVTPGTWDITVTAADNTSASASSTFNITIAAYSQPIPADSLYLSQKVPGNTAKIFSLPVSNGFFAAERITISQDGKEIYYSELDGYFHTSRIKYFKYSDNKWTGPFNLFERFFSPALSPNSDSMYFQSVDNPVTQIWYSVRSDTGWSSPSRFKSNLPLEYLLQETNNGNYYFSSKSSSGGLGQRDWSKLVINGADTALQSLGLPLCTSGDDVDFCVSRDESYIILARANFEISISYHKPNGSWTNPKILTTSRGWAPCLTSDNKYLFFSSGSGTPSIYWERVDNLIDSLKHTNFIPYIKSAITSQTDTAGKVFRYTLTDSIFIDDDGNNTLSYSATLSNGLSLPSWLSFDPKTKTFSGTPSAVGTLSIKVTATDTTNASVSTTFNIIIANFTGIEKDKNKLPRESNLYQNFPNPFNPITNIQYSLAKPSFVKLIVYNMLGQKIRTLQNAFQTAGEYSLVWDGNDDANKRVSSGVYLYRIEEDNIYIQKKMIYAK